MTGLTLNGAELKLDPSGAVWWPKASTLIVADLHLADGAGFPRCGRLLPPFDTRATIDRLAVVIRRYRPGRVLALDDSFHDRRTAQRMDQDDIAELARLVAERDWSWIVAHRGPMPHPPFGGGVMREAVIEPLVFRSAPDAEYAAGEVCGRFHPKAAVRMRGRRISGRCFISDGSRLIVPAFGAYTGGLDALDPSIAELFRARLRVYLIGRDAIYLFPGERLDRMQRPDAALAAAAR